MEIKIFYTMVAVFLVVGGIFVAGLWFLNTGTPQFTENPQLAEESTTPTGETLRDQAEAPATSSILNGSEDIKINTIDADKLYALINAYRRDNKLSTLKAHLLLERSAQMKIIDMQQNKYWTHKDPKGRDSWYMLEQVGYQFEQAGENLSFGYTSPWRVFEEWQKSPEHNVQMLMPAYEHMGLAIDCTSYSNGPEGTCVVVLHLGRQLL